MIRLRHRMSESAADIKHEQRQGVVAAVNRGVRAASGNDVILAVLDERSCLIAARRSRMLRPAPSAGEARRIKIHRMIFHIPANSVLARIPANAIFGSFAATAQSGCRRRAFPRLRVKGS